MSQDITLAPNRNMPVRPEDVWSGQGATTTLGAYQPQNAGNQQPLKKIHRLLRGRYLLAATLGAIGGALGLWWGYNSAKPLYTADALIEVSPRMPSLTAADKAMPFYTQFLKSQQQIIVNTRTINAALQTEEWKAVSNKTPSQEFVMAFANNLTADLIKDSSLIRVSFQHEAPKIAAAAVNAVVKAYLNLAEEANSQSSQTKLDEYNKRLEQAKADSRKFNELMRDAQGEYSNDTLDNIIAKRQEQEMKYQLQIQEMEMKIAQLEASQKAGAKNADMQITEQDIAMQDATMRAMLDNIGKLNADLMNMQIDLGPKHPTVERLVTKIQAQNKVKDEYFEQAKKKYLGINPGMGGNGDEVVTARGLEFFKTSIDLTRKTLTTWHDETIKISKRKVDADRYRDEVAKCKEDIDKYQKLIEQLEFTRAMTGSIRPINTAIEPLRPSKDPRAKLGLMGFVIGSGSMIGLVLLWGLIDSRRYTYSDDAGGSAMSGLPLLGILPDLPDRLSDPGQASIAAHCVHQIRTMLQLNNYMPKSAFCVTSAASGDGKTSLTLALGLSFAASGQRTLLIDSDLVGAGLTTRLGLSGPEGILEAMTSGDLLRYVKPTDVADLSMLPVGLAQLHHAGIFSPVAVRRLITEAKKHFEVILIDTGPVLGSIEATPVCAASDGVILTVARGQQRPLVEKALQHLTSIGARIAGVVFNKAMSRDFEQSISGISMRSAARNTSHHNGSGKMQRERSGQYGPVAKAVAHSVKGENAEN